nr:hypothetical protein [Tanacetum cinerariifolium]
MKGSFLLYLSENGIYALLGYNWIPGRFEIGRDYETKRYFFNSTPTGFGQQYGKLFKGTACSPSPLMKPSAFFIMLHGFVFKVSSLSEQHERLREASLSCGDKHINKEKGSYTEYDRSMILQV